VFSAQFLKFIVVGVGNTVFGYGVFAIIWFLTGSYRVAIVIATIIGTLFNFFTTGRLVFANRSMTALAPFVLVYAVTCGFNILLVDLMVWAGLNPLIAQLISIPPVVLAAYLLNARLVFRKQA
jgi:putative flippase GtrA